MIDISFYYIFCTLAFQWDAECESHEHAYWANLLPLLDSGWNSPIRSTAMNSIGWGGDEKCSTNIVLPMSPLFFEMISSYFSHSLSKAFCVFGNMSRWVLQEFTELFLPFSFWYPISG